MNNVVCQDENNTCILSLGSHDLKPDKNSAYLIRNEVESWNIGERMKADFQEVIE